MTFSSQGQEPTGFIFGMDYVVGCQTLALDPDGPKRGFSFEEIKDTDCFKVCKDTEVGYFIKNNSNGSFEVLWEIIGGVLQSPNNTDNIRVVWGDIGFGSVKIIITDNETGNIIEKNICIEVIPTPTVNFTIAPLTEVDAPLASCSQQNLFFTNLSSTNNGSDLLYYNWNFGDGTFSSEFQPSHSYEQDGVYTITLTVTNACYCSSIISKQIRVGKKGINITCPGVVCDNQSVSYTLPQDAIEACRRNGIWSVVGGTLNSVNQNVANITWNQVDTNGFGYLSFDPSGCETGCFEITTIKIPVIQSIGTIKGVSYMCTGSQERFTLPQWPSTDFKWEIIGNELDTLAHVMLTDQGNEIVIQPLVSGPLTLRCIYYNTLLKCGGTATFPITVSTPVTVTGDDEVCMGTNTIFETSNGAEKNWVLKNDDDVTLSTVLDAVSFSYNFTIAGNYKLSINGEGVCFGFDKIIKVLESAPTPNVANIIKPSIVCPNLPYNFSLPNLPGFEYHWSVASGGVFVGSSIGDAVSIKFDGAATHTIFIVCKRISSAICASLPLTFTINTKQILAQISNNLPETVCSNVYSDYMAFNSGSSSLFNVNGATFNWVINPSTAGSITQGQGTNSIKILWNNTATNITATLSLEIKDCTVTNILSKTITIVGTPNIVVNSNSSVCAGSPITFNLTSTNGVPITATINVEWDFGNGNIINGTGSSISYTFSNSNNTNVSGTVSAKVINYNSCTTNSNIATKIVTIFPSPIAAATISNGVNNFCTPQSINTTLTATISPTNATIQWFRVGSNLVLGTGSTLIVNNTTNFGFGNYYFNATNTQGCVTKSNVVNIFQYCIPIDEGCVNTEPFFNNSAIDCSTPSSVPNCNCNQINLSAVLPANPIAHWWQIITPYGTIQNYNANTFSPAVPGNYIITKFVTLWCNGEEIGRMREKTVTVPYFANFNYTAKCSTANNNTYDIALIDNSPFFNVVPTSSRTFNYYKSNSAAGPWTLVASTQNPTFLNQPTGNYFFKLEVSGSLNGVQQTPCEKIVNVNITALASQNILVGDIFCHDTAVRFRLNSEDGAQSFLWTFEPGVTSTLAKPQRVFDTSGIKTVTCEITTPYGCKKTITTTLTIPAKCFDGKLTPLVNPSRCLGGSVALTYVPKAGDCPIVKYTWMREGILFRTTTTPTINVFNSDVYTVTVENSLGCKFTPANNVIPEFLTPTTVTLKAPESICMFQPIEINALTQATTLRWYIDSVYHDIFDNQKTINWNIELPAGIHTFEVIVTDINGCQSSASCEVNILPGTPIPQLSYTIIECKPYQVAITASGVGPFNWSNGMTGETITVTEGGVYKVTAAIGNCSSTASITVPKNLENYIWTFPAGCVDVCQRDTPSIFGPIAQFTNWSWNLVGTTLNLGSGFVIPQPLENVDSGLVLMTLENEVCKINSKYLSLTKVPCEKCDVQIITSNIQSTNSPFCQYTIDVAFNNLTNSPISATFSTYNNTLFFQPSSFVINPGNTNMTFTLIPINGFDGGAITLTLNGVNADGSKCLSLENVNLPFCNQNFNESARLKDTSTISLLKLTPNPTATSTTIEFSDENANATIEIYDLLGKKHAQYQTTTNKGSWLFDSSNLASGVYIVVFKNSLGFQSQQKLIKQ